MDWDELPVRAQEDCEQPQAGVLLSCSPHTLDRESFNQHRSPSTQHSAGSWKAESEAVPTTGLRMPSGTTSASPHHYHYVFSLGTRRGALLMPMMSNLLLPTRYSQFKHPGSGWGSTDGDKLRPGRKLEPGCLLSLY